MAHRVKIAQWPAEPVMVDDGTTILDAALDLGVPFPHGCRSGNCGACKSRIYAGRVRMDLHSDFALSAEEAADGFALACRAHPETDVELAWAQDDAEMVAHPLRRFTGTVAAVEQMTHDIRRVRIAIPADVRFAFSAGQFASLGFGALPARDYSMANAPDRPDFLEFHIRAQGGATSRYVAEQLAVGEPVRVEGPFGSSYLRETHRGPIIAVAGGSGLAPIHSIVETALTRGLPQPIFLYVGARDERDVYLEAEFADLAKQYPRLRFTYVLSEPSGPTPRRTGLVGDVVADDFDDLDGCKLYLAGPPVMVESAVEKLQLRDARPEDIHADAFYTEADKAALR
jgi:CDP-4-dehydro-6-deoxyglucose reductase/ferredoxin-NAD(P)+ reductase (naphthalene dioxygenase ferredoxin-specific)